MSAIKSLILDLGNTVFYIDFDLTFKYWGEKSNTDWQLLKDRFQWDEQHILFEKGLLSEMDFVKHISETMQIPLSLDDFIVGWNEIYLENLEGIEVFMERVGKKYRLLALSNTNFTHERVWKDKYRELFSHFEFVFASHHMEAVKPEPAIYQQVIDYLQLEPCEMVFCDDKKENIEGAEKMGMHGIVVSSPDQMYRDLRALGVEWANS